MCVLLLVRLAAEMVVEEQPKALVKILVLGASNVGKTSLIKRFASGHFDEERRVTVGVDFVSKRLTLGETLCTVQLWDTAGQERFQTNSLTSGFYRNADGALLVYDVSVSDSFDQLLRWRHECLNKLPESQRHSWPLVVIGNKLDNRQDRALLETSSAIGSDGGSTLSFDDVVRRAAAFCQEMEYGHLLTSAKDGLNVEVAVEAISALALDKNRTRSASLPSGATIDFTNMKPQQKSTCC